MATPAEFTRRLLHVQRGLRRRGLDALIVFDRFNAFYLTGFSSSLSYLLITPGEAVLLVDGRYIEAATDAVEHFEVHLFKKLPASLKTWQRANRARGIGFEGSIPWSVWRQFTEALPEIEWHEAGDLVLGARVTKSSAEIKKIAASAKLNDQVYEAALRGACEGATELDVRNVIRGRL